jgi:hypothetical protein
MFDSCANSHKKNVSLSPGQKNLTLEPLVLTEYFILILILILFFFFIHFFFLIKSGQKYFQNIG